SEIENAPAVRAPCALALRPTRRGQERGGVGALHSPVVGGRRGRVRRHRSGGHQLSGAAGRSGSTPDADAESQGRGRQPPARRRAVLARVGCVGSASVAWTWTSSATVLR